MSDIGILLGCAGTFIGVCGTVYGIYTNKKRNDNMDQTDSRNEGKQTGAILTELGYIKSSVDDIKRKQEQQDSRHFELVQQFAGYGEFKDTTERRLCCIESKLEKREK